MPVQRPFGYLQQRCSFFSRQSREIAQQDDLRLERIERFELRQRLVNRQHIFRRRLQYGAGFIQLLPPPVASLLQIGFAARLLHKYVAHGPSGGKEEVPAAFPGYVAVAGNPKIDLVNESSRLERLARRLPRQACSCQPVELGINEGQEICRGLAIAGLRRLQ